MYKNEFNLTQKCYNIYIKNCYFQQEIVERRIINYICTIEIAVILCEQEKNSIVRQLAKVYSDSFGMEDVLTQSLKGIPHFLVINYPLKHWV